MSFDWIDYLELARFLNGQANRVDLTEALQRTAVSRAYYAAFGFALNYAKASLGFKETGSSQDHQKLREHFEKSGKLLLASRLNKLRLWRNSCDYEDQVPNIPQYVKNAIQEADKVIQECK